MDFSKFEKWHEFLHSHGLEMIQYNGFYSVDDKNIVTYNEEKLPEILTDRSKMVDVFAAWFCFENGINSLLRAMLIKHESFTLVKNNPPEHFLIGDSDSLKDECLEVINSYSDPLSFTCDGWLKDQCEKLGIRRSGDISNRAIDFFDLIGDLAKLKKIKIITEEESYQLYNAYAALMAFRTKQFFIFTQKASPDNLRDDINNIFVPWVNLLIDVYHRSKNHIN